MKFTPAEVDFELMVREKIGGNHFSQFVGFDITDIRPGYIEAHLVLKPEHLQQMGYVHGGVTATMADVVSGFAAFTLVKRGQGVVTADLRVSYLNPGIGSIVYAKGYVIKAGTKLHFCEAELWMINENKQRIDIAKSSSTMVVVP
ncbi:MAG: PaaI family thioesterase [Bacteroidia bacterium]|jgi:uncharacterized protein (TIGR00369 family)|nr:PaaI family thioesterase [Bacteroidia bacterium]